jgi:hypothetical protein
MGNLRENNYLQVRDKSDANMEITISSKVFEVWEGFFMLSCTLFLFYSLAIIITSLGVLIEA